MGVHCVEKQGAELGGPPSNCTGIGIPKTIGVTNTRTNRRDRAKLRVRCTMSSCSCVTPSIYILFDTLFINMERSSFCETNTTNCHNIRYNHAPRVSLTRRSPRFSVSGPAKFKICQIYRKETTSLRKEHEHTCVAKLTIQLDTWLSRNA
jgi:hypothetical protein